MIAPLLLLLMNPALDAQANAVAAPVVCPEFTVLSSAGQSTITFTLISSGAPDDISLNWLISAGTIVSGQGTPVIEVSVEPGTFVTASVDIGGVSRDCPTFISASDEIFPAYEADEPEF